MSDTHTGEGKTVAEEVAPQIEEAAEEIAGSVEKPTGEAVDNVSEVADTIDTDSKEAAEEVADTLEEKGVTLSPSEKEELADMIATRTVEKLSKKVEPPANPPKSSDSATPPKRDRAPQNTHWSERRLWGGKR